MKSMQKEITNYKLSINETEWVEIFYEKNIV